MASKSPPSFLRNRSNLPTICNRSAIHISRSSDGRKNKFTAWVMDLWIVKQPQCNKVIPLCFLLFSLLLQHPSYLPAKSTFVHPPFPFFSLLSLTPSFLDAFSHLYKRVCPSVGQSVGRSVGHTRVEFLIFQTEMKQNRTKNVKLNNLKDIKAKIEQKSINNMKDLLKTSTRVDRRVGSRLMSVLSQIFLTSLLGRAGEARITKSFLLM